MVNTNKWTFSYPKGLHTWYLFGFIQYFHILKSVNDLILSTTVTPYAFTIV